MAALPTIDRLGRDLLVTTPARRRFVFLRPLVGVALFATAWATGAFWLAPVGVFVAFLCVIAATHDLVHSSLGLRRNVRDAVLFVLPALVLQSGHVYRSTHPQHHRAFPHGEDPEGLVADRSLLRCLAEGPLFLPRLWLWSYRRASAHPRQRRLLAGEAAVPIAGLAAGAALLPWTSGLLAWTVLNALAGWLLPLLTVWLPHRRHGDTPETVAGSLRWPVVPRLLLGLTYHLEHHLYPQVPSQHMAELARRLAQYDRDGERVLAGAARLIDVVGDKRSGSRVADRERHHSVEAAALPVARGGRRERVDEVAVRVADAQLDVRLEGVGAPAHVQGAGDRVARQR